MTEPSRLASALEYLNSLAGEAKTGIRDWAIEGAAGARARLAQQLADTETARTADRVGSSDYDLRAATAARGAEAFGLSPDPEIERDTFLPKFDAGRPSYSERDRRAAGEDFVPRPVGFTAPQIAKDLAVSASLPGQALQGYPVSPDDVTGLAANATMMPMGSAPEGAMTAGLRGRMPMPMQAFPRVALSAEQQAVMDANRAGIGHNSRARPKPTTLDVLNARAAEMELPVKNRVQPTPGAERYLAETIQDYERTQAMMPKGVDISTTYPQGGPGKALPKGGRANVFTEYGDSIAEGLADRMRPYMDNPVRYFYHTGPLYEGALKAGLTPAEAELWMKDFGNAYAATSPRTTTDINLRNASLVMNKRAGGIPLNEVLGPGTIGANAKKGINERGYPMMIGEGGIHGQLVADLETGGISRATNTKPSVFAENSAGNLSGVTVDTHAIRGALDVLNEKHPGAIPLEYIKKQYREAYQFDPTKMNAATWLEDTVASQAFKKAKSQVEYGHVAGVYHRAADILGVTPAEAQAMGWFGSGHRTGLSSQQKTIVNLMNDRIEVTAKILGISQAQAARQLYRREIPLLTATGIGATGAANKEPE